MSKTCETCKWYNGQVAPEERLVVAGLEGAGECRRRAPVPQFPLVMSNDWCGEHKAEEGAFDRHCPTCCGREVKPETHHMLCEKHRGLQPGEMLYPTLLHAPPKPTPPPNRLIAENKDKPEPR